jgi:hypothetical protein
VRGRLVAIAIALAVLACVAIGHDRQTPTAPERSSAASGQLAGPPAPASDAPAILTAAGNTSATLPSALVIDFRAHPGPVPGVSTLTRHASVTARTTGKPLVFPLLI